jgi:hypothetical protein
LIQIHGSQGQTERAVTLEEEEDTNTAKITESSKKTYLILKSGHHLVFIIEADFYP